MIYWSSRFLFVYLLLRIHCVRIIAFQSRKCSIWPNCHLRTFQLLKVSIRSIDDRMSSQPKSIAVNRSAAFGANQGIHNSPRWSKVNSKNFSASKSIANQTHIDSSMSRRQSIVETFKCYIETAIDFSKETYQRNFALLSALNLLYHRRIYDFHLVEEAMKIISKAEKNSWSMEWIHKYLHMCVRTGRLDYLRSFLTLFENNPEERLPHLLDMKAIVILMNGFSTLQDADGLRKTFELHRNVLGFQEHMGIRSSVSLAVEAEKTNQEVLFRVKSVAEELVVVQNSYLKGLLKLSLHDEAENHFAYMQAHPEFMDIVTFSTMLTFYAEKGLSSKFESLWLNMSANFNLDSNRISLAPNQLKALCICQSQRVRFLINSGRVNDAYSYVSSLKELEPLATFMYHCAYFDYSPLVLLEILVEVLSRRMTVHISRNSAFDLDNSANLDQWISKASESDFVHSHRMGISTIVSRQLFGDQTSLNSPVSSQKLSTADEEPGRVSDISFVYSVGDPRYSDPFASMLSGYLIAGRPDLAVMTYLYSCDLQPVGSKLLSSHPGSRYFSSIKQGKRLLLPPSCGLEPMGSTKSFNVFLAGLKEVLFGSNSNSSGSNRYVSSNRRRVSKTNEAIHEAAATDSTSETDNNGHNSLLMWSFVKDAIRQRDNLNLCDVYTIGIAMDLANGFADREFASYLWALHLKGLRSLEHSISFNKSDSSTSNLKGHYNGYGRPNPSIASGYLRSFTSDVDAEELHRFMPLYQVRGGPTAVALPLGLPADARLIDELINAYLRTGGLPAGLAVCDRLMTGGSSGKRFRFSNSAVANLLIYFDRYWRDYNNDDWPESEADPKGYQFLGQSRGLFAEAKKLSAILQVKSSVGLVDSAGFDRDVLKWAAIAAVLISRGHFREAANVFLSMEDHYNREDIASSPSSTQHCARALSLAVFSALEGKFPLLTADAWQVDSSLNRRIDSRCMNSGLTAMLSGIPSQYHLKAGSKRTECSIGDVVEFLESLSAIHPSNENVQNSGNASSDGSRRLPVPMTLLEGIFVDGVSSGKHNVAARIVRVLERVRLVVDLDLNLDLEQEQADLGASAPAASAAVASATPSSVDAETVRIRWARKWAAQLVGKSLSKFGKNVSNSMKMVSKSKQILGSSAEIEHVELN